MDAAEGRGQEVELGAEPAGEVESEMTPPSDVGPRPGAPAALEVPFDSTSAEGAPEEEDETGTHVEIPGEPPPVLDVASLGLDADGAEEWIAAVEAEATSEAEAVTVEPQPPTVVEIDLELEPDVTPDAEQAEVIRIRDRDAAGEHEPAVEGSPEASRHVRDKRRWNPFRRGGVG